MENAIHKNLVVGRWFELSFAEQMGNIGSEVGRAVARQKRGDDEQKEKALERAFELIDLTAADPRWRRFSRLKEIMRAREILADLFYGDNMYRDTPEKMEKYFFEFALAARNFHLAKAR